jgi:RimJ/RimL family protein N-acetyltransferase
MTSRFDPIPDARPEDSPWPSMEWPVDPDRRLVGETVELAVLDLARDVAELFAALDDQRVWQHLSLRPRGVQEYVDQLGRALATGRLPWVVRLRVPLDGLAAGTVVGTSSYLDVSVTDARLEIGSTAYAPVVWGSTVNPETKLLLLGHAFDDLHVGRVQLKTDVRNVRSQQAIARLGASYEGTLRRYQRRADGSMRDTVMFSVTAEEWPTVRRALQERIGVAEPSRATPRRP